MYSWRPLCLQKQWHQKVNEVYIMEQVITKIPMVIRDTSEVKHGDIKN